MSNSLDGKVAVVTGTGRGIAREVALRFAAEGAKVVGCDIDEEACAETVKLVRAAGGEMEALHPLDLTVEENAHELFEFTADRFGGLDVLYNSAMSMRIGTIEDLTAEEWRFTLDNTLTLQYLVTKHAVPHLRKRGGGSIVFVASMSGMQNGSGYPGNLPFLLAYACAKAGVLRMTNVLANELSEIGVRVNSISPGCIGTPAGMTFYGEPGSELRRVSESGTLIKRLGEPRDIADAALFLAGEGSSYVTGQNLVVDGGFDASGGAGRATDVDKAVYAPLVAKFSQVDEGWTTSGTPKPR